MVDPRKEERSTVLWTGRGDELSVVVYIFYVLGGQLLKQTEYPTMVGNRNTIAHFLNSHQKYSTFSYYAILCNNYANHNTYKTFIPLKSLQMSGIHG